MPRLRCRILFSAAALILATTLPGAAQQQVADSSFRCTNPSPTYPAAAGPEVCVDAGHLNFHTQLDESLLEEKAETEGVSADFLRERLPRDELGEHPILHGLRATDAVESVMAFGGSALFPTDRVQPLLLLGDGFTGTTPAVRSLQQMAREEMPRYDLARWIQAGAVTLGHGRAVVLAEAAMCTAQIFRAGTEHATPRGMNTPMATQNAPFCLNLVRWLSGGIGGQS